MKGGDLMSRSVVLYGLGGIEDRYRTLNYFVVYEEDLTIETLKYRARKMVYELPMIEHVYAIDNSRDIYLMFRKSLKTLEDRIVFKDWLERNGVEIPF